MFVTTLSYEPLSEVGGAYLIRLMLSPAELPETAVIADTCRAGGSVVLRIRGSSVPPFVVSAVTDNAEALALVSTRDRAIAILRALELPTERKTQ